MSEEEERRRKIFAKSIAGMDQTAQWLSTSYAPMLAQFKQSLEHEGFTEDQAFELCRSFLVEQIRQLRPPKRE